MRTYLTAAELSRALNVPQSRISTALESNVITADGRAGHSTNSPIIFALDRLEKIKAALAAQPVEGKK